jgi:hypothetical protein
VERALIRRVDAGDDLHERRLACAVVADERDDLAGADLEVHAIQRLDGSEPLAHVAERQQGRSCVHVERYSSPADLHALANALVQICAGVQ